MVKDPSFFNFYGKAKQAQWGKKPVALLSSEEIILQANIVYIHVHWDVAAAAFAAA